MAFIDYIPYENASEGLKNIYSKYGGKTKTPANIIRISGSNPPSMQAHIDLYRSIMFQKSDISRHQREMIAVVVSSINECHYWITHHWNALHSLGGVEETLKTELTQNFRTANITEQEILILEYAEKITKEPSNITKDDVTKLLENGFSETAIHDIVQVTSYFNYVNRIADALGIELESK